jgi:Flp pilus assembly pilin Flp
MRRTRCAPRRRRAARGDRGATGLEYGLLIAGTSVVAMLGISTLGQSTFDNLTCFTQQFGDPQSSSGCVSGTGAGAGGDPTPTGSTDPGPDPVQPARQPTVTATATETAAPTASPSETATPSPTLSPTPTP